MGEKSYICYWEYVGAVYYEINSTKENSIRFWKSIGFIPNGKDEYDMSLFYKESLIILIALILDNEVQILHDFYMEVQILHLRRMRGAK